MSSAEARPHWQRPDGLEPSPSALMRALAREDLLLDFVGRAVADVGVLVDAAGRAGLDIHSSLRVALDASLLSFEAPSFADTIADVVRGHGQEHHRFVWEINDVTLARAPGSASAPLTRLRVKGFGLALRHTGTGPAWTSLLGRIPLSELTLDRRLVTGAAGDQKRFARLEGALAEASETGLPVVADGCDSSADLDTLLALGCSEAQGQLVGGALPAADVIPWALSGKVP
jgi:EAL domain-containing protein (putative c-di-GMP-specific phosphodiesterase class I)